MSRLNSLACLVLAIFIGWELGFSAEPQTFSSDIMKSLKWRHIGPASFGGRIDDVEAVPDNPSVIFVGAASGGIFRSRDQGVTWDAVFDADGTALSIGDIAIAPSDPGIIWAGTGEPNNRQSSSWGDGVYKSLDGGDTWTNMGLKETRHIGKIKIDPRNPNVVFVAALGHLWGPNPERGVFRTRDGGKTWDKSLYIDENTGVVDIDLEENGRVLYAAAFQRQRKPWGYIGGGPKAGVYRSLDGGDTWEKLQNGLPGGDIGRIGLAIAPSRPSTVYAIIEHKSGGLFRSDDRGRTWTMVHQGYAYPSFACSYFQHLRVDPQNPEKVWIVAYLPYVSVDGGKTFTTDGVSENLHTDSHTLWINPRNADHLLLAGDGGFYISHSGARTWDFIGNLPVSQFYAIGIDTRDPYWIYGGAQDAGAYGIPSRTDSPLGIMNRDVVPVVYGDGFYCVVDPRDPNLIYSENQEGRVIFTNLKTHEERLIGPVPKSPEEVYRFNWKCPLVMSPHNPDVVYFGGNKIFKTSDRGHSWEEISPDLSRNQDWKKLPIMGMERTPDTLALNYGVGHYGTVTTISESPLQPGLIYAGTDDGNIQVTADAGRTWKDLTKNIALPRPRWVTDILASQHDAGTAFVSFTGHSDDDTSPYIFKTVDFGISWKSIRGDLADGIVVRALAEHPQNSNLLFAGTEFGLFISINGGRNWVRAGGNLPRVRVDDIVINPRNNDLILGTHGRGIVILDDIAALENLDPSVLDSEAALFPVREATISFETREDKSTGSAEFAGPNPDYGALITYYLRSGLAAGDPSSQAEKSVKILIADANGNAVRELQGPAQSGINRISWDLRCALKSDPEWKRGAYYYPLRGPAVLPGEYTVQLIAGGRTLVQKMTVKLDPRIGTTEAALHSRLKAGLRISDMVRAFLEAKGAILNVEKETGRIQESAAKDAQFPKEAKALLDEISKSIEGLKKEFISEMEGMEFDVLDLLGQVEASTSEPTLAQGMKIDRLNEKLDKGIELINAILTEKLPGLQKMLNCGDYKLSLFQPVKPPEH
jgi:photosystem II stability/assembly factor-like uncharacterized protein